MTSLSILKSPKTAPVSTFVDLLTGELVPPPTSDFSRYELTTRYISRPGIPAEEAPRLNKSHLRPDTLCDCGHALQEHATSSCEGSGCLCGLFRNHDPAALVEVESVPDWGAIGQRSAAYYLEQIAKPHTRFDFELKNEVPETFLTCATAGVSRMAEWSLIGEDKNGHAWAKEIVCGREWCRRCGDNATPETEGSAAHRRKISRWLPKALQMEKIGYFVFTIPMELRQLVRSKEELSALGTAARRILQRNGFSRGLRSWDWFGDKSVEAGRPVFHPHLNLLVDGGFLSAEVIESVKKSWAMTLQRRYKRLVPVVSVHYSYAETPGQKYHRVRYVTRATFLNWRWDEQAATVVAGFRGHQAWGKWDGEPVWSLVEANAPTSAEQSLAGSICPDCQEAIDWTDAPFMRRAVLERFELDPMGSGFHRLRKRPWKEPPHGDINERLRM